MLPLYPSYPTSQWKGHMHVLKPEAIQITMKNIQNVLTNIKIIYIYLYIYGPFQGNGERIMHKQSSRSEWANKTTKDKWNKPGRGGKTWDQNWKENKEPNQMESVANAASIWNGWSSQGRLPCLNLNGEWWHGARVVCVEGRIWHPVSKRACDGEGTLRFQGYFPLFL